MTSMRQWLRTSRFLLFILLGMSLFWESCDNAVKQAQSRVSSVKDTLPDTLSTQGLTIIDNFDGASGDLGPDFIFDGSQDKATYFRLNEHQTKPFFDELEKIMNSPNLNDSARIRVHLGLYAKKGTRENGRPNLSVLMSILNNDVDPSARPLYFPLRVLPNQAPSSGFNWIVITNKLADSLTNNWKNTSIGNINKQLYQNSDPSTLRKRIQYYTFNSSDTKDIYEYRKKNPDCGFYLYLGVFDESEHVPLRVIVRLTKNRSARPTSESDDDGDGDNYEFAVQCPPVCN